jgi:hypothetical protein
VIAMLTRFAKENGVSSELLDDPAQEKHHG